MVPPEKARRIGGGAASRRRRCRVVDLLIAVLPPLLLTAAAVSPVVGASFQLVGSDTVGSLRQPRRRRECLIAGENPCRHTTWSRLRGDDDDDESSDRATAAVGTAPTSTPQASTRQYDPSLIPADSTTLMRLAIFPLRKSVRFPTERLTLNLYEDRYVALAEDVLQLRNDHEEDMVASLPGRNRVARIRGLFGALYSGSCPHIVPALRRGANDALVLPPPPITPLVERGDVGVMCGVDSYVDGTIPTLRSVVTRRRIRLESHGLARFQVERVVNNGYEGLVRSKTNALPYVVVEARAVNDATLGIPAATEFDRKIRSASMKLWGMPPDEYLESNGLVPAIGNPWNTDKAVWETRRRELLSFAVASRAMERDGTDGDATARRELLLLDDPCERLRRVSD